MNKTITICLLILMVSLVGCKSIETTCQDYIVQVEECQTNSETINKAKADLADDVNEFKDKWNGCKVDLANYNESVKCDYTTYIHRVEYYEDALEECERDDNNCDDYKNDLEDCEEDLEDEEDDVERYYDKWQDCEQELDDCEDNCS